MIRKAGWVLLTACLIIGGSRSSAAFEVSRCEPLELTDVLAAASFVDQNLTAMVDQMTFLNREQQAEIIRKWPRLNLRCRERLGCRKVNVLGYAHGGPGNSVNICHATMVDLGSRLCDLVETIVHESGHAHGFPAFKDHNDPIDHPDVFQNDPIYRMGNIAHDVCTTAANAGSFVDRTLLGTPRLPIGSSCGRNTDCQSVNCRGGTCICVQDGDCGTDQICVKLGTNTCEAANLPSGSACKRDRQCQSGKCRRDSCS